jgi:hypothetical protein
MELNLGFDKKWVSHLTLFNIFFQDKNPLIQEKTSKEGSKPSRRRSHRT